MAPDNRFGRFIGQTLDEAEPVAASPVEDERSSMRLEIREVDGLDLAPPLVLTGTWAWLLFHDAGELISYSDGYATRSACYAAAKQIAWPVDVFE
ncbi:hypothetical protein U1708_14660 [Sphingomonas sp. ZB1N12]|uniref:hypothetical protein n=1 Tax=Sphingomonas arabinosi TaxID=3096160 RepID=UPI002FCC87DD